MTPGDDEARLRAAMAEAHREDARRTPRFEATWAAAPAAPDAAGDVAMGGALHGAGLPGQWACGFSAADPSPSAWLTLGTRWAGLTDFLLETPNLIALRSLPTLPRFMRPRGHP